MVTQAPSRLRLHYVLIGLVYGAVWALNGNEPAWEHAVIVLALVLFGLPLSYVVRAKLAKRGKGPDLAHLAFGRLAVAKVLLVVCAIAVDIPLERVTPFASVIVGLGLTLVVAGLGPVAHRRVFSSADSP